MKCKSVPGISRQERLSDEGLKRLEMHLETGSKISSQVIAQWIKRYGEPARKLINAHGENHPEFANLYGQDKQSRETGYMAGNRLVVADAEFVTGAVRWITTAVVEAVSARGSCHLMLAGGATPLPVYRALAQTGLPWANLMLYFGDERCVPPDHKESNYQAITASLFPQGIPQGVKLHRMRGEDDPETAARLYESLLPERMDILLLGMGEDGHTASLFPGSAALNETNRLVMPVIGSKPPPQRLTITPPVIQSARKILVMVEGKGKANAVQQVWEKGDLPVALARQGDWLLDEAAASAL